MPPRHGRLSSSRTVSHGQSSEKISVTARLSGGRLANLLRQALQKNEYLGSEYDMTRVRRLFCACFSSQS